jgi:hypothetical protein
LTPGKLTGAGFHFAPGVSTVSEQLASQGNLPAHQELTFEWNSLPGITKDIVRKEEVHDIPLSSKFVLLNRKRNVEGGVSLGRPPYLVDDELVFVAVTPENVVRSISIAWDPRASFSEDLANPRAPRVDFVKPKVTFDITIPDDPQVTKIALLRPVADKVHVARLERVATIELPNAK